VINKAIPASLVSTLQRAALAIDDDGELPSAVRGRIFQQIRVLSDAHAGAAYLRQARLALACGLEVVGYLKGYPAPLAFAQAMLANGINTLDGLYSLAALQKDNETFQSVVVSLFEEGDAAFSPVYAGLACYSAINAVLHDATAVSERGDALPPEDWDVGYYSSLAVSGSAVWEGKGGAAARRTFWYWYLEQAIPGAWDLREPLLRLPVGLSVLHETGAAAETQQSHASGARDTDCQRCGRG
jgi:hypothetical protein